MNDYDMRYMDCTDELAFKDMQKLGPLPHLRHECPKCKGHGGWNLLLDQYPNAENPSDRHFKQQCGMCWGYGYTRMANPCDHVWGGRTTIGKCLHLVKCTACGLEMEIDSSD